MSRDHCSHKRPQGDTHKKCFSCLGVGHDMAVCNHCLDMDEAVLAPRRARQRLWALYPKGEKAPIADRSENFYLEELRIYVEGTVGRDAELGESSSDAGGADNLEGEGGASGSNGGASGDKSFLEEGDLDRLFDSGLSRSLAPFEPLVPQAPAGGLFHPLSSGSGIVPGSELDQTARLSRQFRPLGRLGGIVVPNRPMGSRATATVTTTGGNAHGGGTIFPTGAPTGGMDTEAGACLGQSQLPSVVTAVPSAQPQRLPSWFDPSDTTVPLAPNGGLYPPPLGTAGGLVPPPLAPQPSYGGMPLPTAVDPSFMQREINRMVLEALRQQPVPPASLGAPITPQRLDVSMDTSYRSLGAHLPPTPLGDEASHSRTEQYRRYLNEILTLPGGTPELMVQRQLPRDSLDHLSGDVSTRAPWGLTLPVDRTVQLQTSFTNPQVTKSLTNSSSQFRMLPTVFASAFRAPSLDPYLATHGSSARTKPKAVDPGQVASWRRQVGPLYEASMAAYRLGIHQSVMTNALHQMVVDHGLTVLAPTVAYLAQSERELMATAAQAAGHAVGLMRRMALGPLCYAQPVKKALVAVPFEGDMLFGPSLSAALQTETEKAKQAKDEDTLLYERPSVLQRSHKPQGAQQRPAQQQQQAPRQRGPKRPYPAPKSAQAPKPPKAPRPSAPKNKTPKAHGRKDHV